MFYSDFFIFIGLKKLYGSGQKSLLNRHFWMPRPFCSTSVRDLIAMQQGDRLSSCSRFNFSNLDCSFLRDDKSWHEMLSCTIEYQSTFGCSSQRCLGPIPFWSGSNSLMIGNNGLADSRRYNAAHTPIAALPADFHAYQLGIGNVKNIGEIELWPTCRQVGADLMFYLVGKSGNRCEFYSKSNAPIGAITVNSGLKEVEVAYPDGLDDQQFLLYPVPDQR